MNSYFAFILLCLICGTVLFVMVIFLSIIILKGFPHDHWLRKFWVKYITTDENLDPPTE